MRLVKAGKIEGIEGSVAADNPSTLFPQFPIPKYWVKCTNSPNKLYNYDIENSCVEGEFYVFDDCGIFID